MEEAVAALRIRELAGHPLHGHFDYAHMKAIHRNIFQDVYEWAGQERVGPVGSFMTKLGPDVVHHALGDPAAPQVPYQYYPAGPALTAAAEEQYRRLAAKDRQQRAAGRRIGSRHQPPLIGIERPVCEGWPAAA